MKLRLLTIAGLLTAVLAAGCSRQKCFDVSYDAFIAKYGDIGEANIHKFCTDKGYDRAYEWDVGNLLGGSSEICCEEDGILDP